MAGYQGAGKTALAPNGLSQAAAIDRRLQPTRPWHNFLCGHTNCKHRQRVSSPPCLQVEFRMEPATRAGGFRVDVRLASKKDGETVEGAVGQARNKQAGKQVGPRGGAQGQGAAAEVLVDGTYIDGKGRALQGQVQRTGGAGAAEGPLRSRRQ